MELERTGRICDAPEAASAREAWWAAAAHCGGPLPWRHDGGDAYAGAGGKVGVADEVEDGDSICSLAADLFPLVEKVRVALTPATSNSTKSAMSFWKFSLIF